MSTRECQRAWIEIDHSALANNVERLKKLLSPSTELMAVVKADAYGHGAVNVAQTALKHGASRLAVATLGEGQELREAGMTVPILILGVVNSPQEIKAIAHWNLEPTVGDYSQAETLSKTMMQLGKTLPVHLKLDTGMSRLGTLWNQATEFVQAVAQLPNLEIASLYSHLATADDPDPTVMNEQHQRFKRAVESLQTQGILPPRLHFANSAATLVNPALHYDWVRIGLALYGLYPAEHLRAVTPLQPALQVKARITQVKTLPAGSGVSYGHRFIAESPLTLAVVGIGYADGIPRNLSNQLKVLIRGQVVPQIGAITMDQLMLDVSNLPNVQPGEVVTLIGRDGDLSISADDWANQLGTISWEILCSFKHRLPRVHVA